MADFTAKDVQALRQSTGVGMMDAKKALTETGGDFDAATKWLREQGLAKAAKREDRDNSDGAIAIAVGDGAAAMVQLKSETDFAAKADDFTSLVQELADLVLAQGESAVDQKKDEIDQLKLTKKENIEVGTVARFEVAEGNVLDAYLHNQEGRGKVGVLVELDAKGTPEQAHELALHIAFKKPKYLSRDEVPADDVERERETLTELTRANEIEEQGKPEAALPKIVEGKLGSWFKDSVLLEQELFEEKGRKVSGELGEATIVRFALATVGA
jgi:elongation factor Ts